jgi:hypothetical protein
MKKKKLLSLLLTVCISLSCVSASFVSVNAASEATETVAANSAAYDKATAFSGCAWIDTQPSVSSATPLVKWTSNVRDVTTDTTDKYNNKTLYTFYVPSGTDMSNLPVYHSYTSLKIGDTSITSGNTYSFETDKIYECQINTGTSAYVQFFQSTSPAMFLNTASELPTKTDRSLSSKDSVNTKGTFLTSNSDGSININEENNNLKKLKGRGNSSWNSSYCFYGKYSYNITSSSAVSLFGMDKGKKWCLLANNIDETMVRNMVTFDLANSLGLTSPQFKSVDLYDNGNYLGTYLVTQKVEVGKNTLIGGKNIDDLNEDANTISGTVNEPVDSDGSTLTQRDTNSYGNNFKYVPWENDPENFESTGTFLLEFEVYNRYDDELSWFETTQGQHIVVKSPELATKSQVEYVSELWQKVEDAVYSGNVESVSDLIDIESFIKMYLIQELSENLDSCETSYYVILTPNGKFTASPVWDYDWAWGQYNRSKYIMGGVKNTGEITGFYAKVKTIPTEKGNSKIYDFQAQLCHNDYFWSEVQDYWPTFYDEASKLLGDSGTIATFSNEISQSVSMNEYRYSFIYNDLLSEKVGNWGSKDTGDTQAETTQWLINWTTERLSWLDSNIRVTVPATTEPTTAPDDDIMLGDVNNDSEIDIKDVTEIQKHLASLTTLTDNQLLAADVDDVAGVDISDATCIQKYIASMISSFPSAS